MLADFKLFPLAGILGAIAFRTAQEPAEVTALELPGRTVALDGAAFFLPARGQGVGPSPLIDQQEINVPLDMGGDCPPALFVAVNGLQGHAEEFCQLFLGLSEFFPGKAEFFLGQGAPRGFLVGKNGNPKVASGCSIIIICPLNTRF